MEPFWEAWAPACLLGLRVPTPIKPDIQPKYTHIPKYGVCQNPELKEETALPRSEGHVPPSYLSPRNVTPRGAHPGMRAHLGGFIG